MSERPFSQACENNKAPILEVLKRCLERDRVLEIGSGTGQHARYFAEHLPGVSWQPTDMAANLPAIRSWCAGYSGDNLSLPLELDVRSDSWPATIADVVFTANSLHIMAWSSVQQLFHYLGKYAPIQSRLMVYGPFNYAGRYTSDSNARFDQWLAEQHADSAIRDFEAVNDLAETAGYSLQEDNQMPANNRLLVWVRINPSRLPA